MFLYTIRLTKAYRAKANVIFSIWTSPVYNVSRAIILQEGKSNPKELKWTLDHLKVDTMLIPNKLSEDFFHSKQRHAINEHYWYNSFTWALVSVLLVHVLRQCMVFFVLIFFLLSILIIFLIFVLIFWHLILFSVI